MLVFINATLSSVADEEALGYQVDSIFSACLSTGKSCDFGVRSTAADHSLGPPGWASMRDVPKATYLLAKGAELFP